MTTNEDLNVQVTMLGGRRCGKTSILAAMKKNFSSVFSGELIMSPCDVKTLDDLDEKNNEILAYFNGQDGASSNAVSRSFIPDSNPTLDMKRHAFQVGIPGKRGTIKINFVDYPGEWLDHSNNHQQTVINYIKNSEAVIIAIDTPHLMEEEGLFNEQRNYCSKISDMFTMAYQELANNVSVEQMPRLVLFVPLKCERYLQDGKMQQVYEKTKIAYNNLIQYLQSWPKTTVAITPIFTLGGAQFSRFKRDENAKIICDNKYGTPEEAIYGFLDGEAGKRPNPKYCEQPVIYLLAYLMQNASDAKAKQLNNANLPQKLLTIFKQSFFGVTSKNDYAQLKNTILKKLKKNGDGYHIIQNPMNF